MVCAAQWLHKDAAQSRAQWLHKIATLQQQQQRATAAALAAAAAANSGGGSGSGTRGNHEQVVAQRPAQTRTKP